MYKEMQVDIRWFLKKEDRPITMGWLLMLLWVWFFPLTWGLVVVETFAKLVGYQCSPWYLYFPATLFNILTFAIFCDERWGSEGGLLRRRIENSNADWLVYAVAKFPGEYLRRNYRGYCLLYYKDKQGEARHVVLPRKYDRGSGLAYLYDAHDLSTRTTFVFLYVALSGWQKHMGVYDDKGIRATPDGHNSFPAVTCFCPHPGGTGASGVMVVVEDSEGSVLRMHPYEYVQDAAVWRSLQWKNGKTTTLRSAYFGHRSAMQVAMSQACNDRHDLARQLMPIVETIDGGDRFRTSIEASNVRRALVTMGQNASYDMGDNDKVWEFFRQPEPVYRPRRKGKKKAGGTDVEREPVS